MSTDPSPATAPVVGVMCQPFPPPGRLVQHAYLELELAATGTKEQVKALGDTRLLPRPWNPATCTNPDLRADLWDWLDHVVTWLNHEYVWDVAGIIPACWPHHPHLVHEIAVLADQRRQAATALTSDPLQEWHHCALPAFTERMRTHLKTHCDDDHQPWPAKSRHTRHTAEPASQDRARTYNRDTETLHHMRANAGPLTSPLLNVVDGHRIDAGTGEILE